MFSCEGKHWRYYLPPVLLRPLLQSLKQNLRRINFLPQAARNLSLSGPTLHLQAQNTANLKKSLRRVEHNGLLVKQETRCFFKITTIVVFHHGIRCLYSLSLGPFARSHLLRPRSKLHLANHLGFWNSRLTWKKILT